MKTNLGLSRKVSCGLVLACVCLAAPWAGAQETIPAATMEVEIQIRDTEALVPLSDWVPLFRVTMSYNADQPAPRILDRLTYRLRNDPVAIDDREYAVYFRLREQDLLDFGLFREENVPDEKGTLDSDDRLLMTWQNTGQPLDQTGSGDLFYNLDFTGAVDINGNPITLPNAPTEPNQGESYIVAVRTSAIWHSGETLSVSVTGAQMIHPFGGPVGDDTYPFDNGPVEEDVAYSASFGVYDITGGPSHNADVDYINAWAHPRHFYTPLAEHSRPRWDLPGTISDFVAGEWLELRELFPIESWVPVIGINAHSTTTWHMTSSNGRGFLDEDIDLREVNVILTDIGADKDGYQGNGGFDPRTMLDPLTAYSVGNFNSGAGGDASFAIGTDFTFNGLWVFHDTNENGLFDPPVQEANGGVTLTDFPLWPDDLISTPGQVDPLKDRWQYIANPPGGGDPWWKMKLRFENGRRRTNFDDEPQGFLEPTPDNHSDDTDSQFFSEFSSDYFLVFRADSGFQDISLRPGDGNGYVPGADFKVMIEPRWYDPIQGHTQGGIYFNSMIPSVGVMVGDTILSAWQDDPRWLADEPFWPERTLGAENMKPMRGSLELHDYTLLYNTNNDYATETNLVYGAGGFFWSIYSDPPFFTSTFDTWMDPYGLRQSRFTYNDTLRVYNWFTTLRFNFGGSPVITDDYNTFQYPFESAPFYNQTFDGTTVGPRSPLYPFPPAQPARPTYATWPADLGVGKYPSVFDWAASERRARILKQRIDIESPYTAMLGINLVGANDNFVNRQNARYLNEFYIAFWGPDFTPSDLLNLDKAGTSALSGVQIRVDNGDGTFFDVQSVDATLPLTNLAWASKAEPVDLDGDGAADDLNGDGIVNSLDFAWVLKITPTSAWPLPISDRSDVPAPGGGTQTDTTGGTGGTGGIGGNEDKRLSASVTPVQIDLEQAFGDSAAKALPGGGNPGDDLFVVVKTSDKLRRFEQFRVFVPATLPSRTSNAQTAGFRFTPSARLSPGALLKVNPDEGPVQDYYFHDMMEANVAVKLSNLAGAGQTIPPGSSAFGVVGIDISTNRGTAEGVVDQGTSGTGTAGAFTVSGRTWVPNAFAGYFLIDGNYESYEITANTTDTLTLVSGTPRNARWFIAKDPTFLEQVIVEFYDEGRDGAFNLLNDLAPLDIDPATSGVSIWRDNDNHPQNRNGLFDPGIDIPVVPDGRPILVGEEGEVPTQVKFVFSSPGTDDVPVPRAAQERRRQWVPDTFGTTATDPATGPDFFVAIRTSGDITSGDDFTVGIVGWGPPTPTQPDPDTWARDGVPEVRRDDLSKYLEFPWGSRALGFITFFKDGLDNSGFNWIRTHEAKAFRSTVIRATSGSTGGGTGGGTDTGSIALTSTNPAVIPVVVPAGGYPITLTGSGFGTAPAVQIEGTTVPVTSSTTTSIVVRVPEGTTYDAGPLAVRVTDTVTTRTVERGDLLTAIAGAVPDPPTITRVSPERGTSTDFPVTVFGTNFNNPQVFFGGTRVPVSQWTATRIDVTFPSGGLSKTGLMDVQVRSVYLVDDTEVVLSTTKANAFTYDNAPTPGRACFIATAAYGTPFERHLDTFRGFRDQVLLKTSTGAAFVDLYYTTSPAVADYVAAHPWLAALIRVLLTPLAWALEAPVAAASAMTALTGALFGLRRLAALRVR